MDMVYHCLKINKKEEGLAMKYLKRAEKKTFSRDSQTTRLVADIIDQVMAGGDQEILKLKGQSIE